MSITLYVDHIEENFGKPIGRVIKLDKINKILEQIEAEMAMITEEMAEMNNVQYVHRAGRYLISTTLALDAPEYKYQMVIVDTKGDETLEMAFIASVKPVLREITSRLISDLHDLTDEEKAKFEMAVGE